MTDKILQDVLSEVRWISDGMHDLEVRFVKLSLDLMYLEKSISGDAISIQDIEKCLGHLVRIT